MPTVMRESFTRTDTSVIYPWNAASPHYTDCQEQINAHNSYIESTFGATIGPFVEVSDLEVYQNFVFPTDQAWVDYIDNFYNDPTAYGERSVPEIPGLSRSTTVIKE